MRGRDRPYVNGRVPTILNTPFDVLVDSILGFYWGTHRSTVLTVKSTPIFVLYSEGSAVYFKGDDWKLFYDRIWSLPEMADAAKTSRRESFRSRVEGLVRALLRQLEEEQ